MRLIKKSERQQDTVTIMPPRPKQTLLGRLFSKPYPDAAKPVEPLSYSGRIWFTSCVIDFENELPTLGRKIAELDFGNVVYRGVSPARRIEGSVYECCVDYFEEK